MERDALIEEVLYDEIGVIEGLKVRLNDKGHIALVDKEDLHFVKDYNWRWHGKNNQYVVRGKRINYKYQLFYLHREIALWHGWHLPDDYEVDHINHVKYDNRKKNLRVVSKSQNQANRRKRKNKERADRRYRERNDYKGVSFNKRTGLYEARIQFGGKYKFIGSFPNGKMAAYFYNEAAKAIHGEYAELNKLEHDEDIK